MKVCILGESENFTASQALSISANFARANTRKRGNLKKLKEFKDAFEKSWQLAKNSDYWNAAILNGIATSSILNSEPNLIMKLMEKGALCATVSGNGPSIMAIVDKKNKSRVQKEFSGLDGRIMISNINNKKAYVHEL